MTRGGGLHVEVDVRVGVQRDGDVGVPQPLLDDPGVDSGLFTVEGVEVVGASRAG